MKVIINGVNQLSFKKKKKKKKGGTKFGNEASVRGAS